MRWIPAINGETRRKSAFLWLPKRIKNETRWLENATWEEMYLGEEYGFWKAYVWIDTTSSTKGVD